AERRFSHPPPAVHVRAPATPTTALRVRSPRPGSHDPLATASQAAGLYGPAAAAPAPGISVTVTGRHAAQVPTDRSNLAWRAAKLLADATGTDTGVRLHVTKGVPTAGGMGGGSADAAATLLACDLLWGTGLAREEL